MMSGITEEGLKQNDPAIKLFGSTIEKTNLEENSAFVSLENESPTSTFFQIAEDGVPESPTYAAAICCGGGGNNALDERGSSLESNDGCADVEKPITRIVDIRSSSVHTQDGCADVEKPITRIVDIRSSAVHTQDECHDDVARVNSEDHTHPHASDQALKRPDKLVPCPRCKSLDTKFCYYNNYNVNQPRHFCKHCQRYWTSGGSLRNVPVGAGRRRNKLSVVVHQRIFPTDGMVVRGDPPDRAQQVLACSGLASPLAMNKHINIRHSSSSPKLLLPLEACSLARSVDSPSSSTVLPFRHECSLGGCTQTSLHQYRAEVLQGYTQELSHGQEMLHPKVEANICPQPLAYVNPHMPVDMGDNKACDAKQIQEQIPITTAIGIRQEALRQHVGKPVSTHVGAAQSQKPILIDPKPASADSNDMLNHDAAHGCATNDHAPHGWAPGVPFPFMGGPWQYAGNAGWANPSSPTAFTTALQGALSLYSDTICANPSQAAAACVNQPPWTGALGAFWAGFPWTLMQSPFWGPPGAWTMPWAPAALAATAAAAAIAAASATAAAAGNPMLASSATGKREREQEHPADSEKQGSLIVPKLLRIDDPGEAVQSSIWATLGIDKRSDSLGSGGMISSFQPKAESKEGDDTHVQARYSNPAALTRSYAFQERATQNVNVRSE